MSLNTFILNGELVIIFTNDEVKWYQSLRWRLFIIFFLISFVPLLIFYSVMQKSLKEYFEEMNAKELLYQSNKIAGSIQNSGYLQDPSKYSIFSSELEEKSKEGSYRIIVTNSKGIVINDTNKTEIGKTFLVPEIITALDGKDVANFRKEEDAIYVAAYIENENYEKVGVVLLIFSFNEVTKLLEGIMAKWLLTTISISIFVAIIGYFISKITLEPLTRFLRNIKKIIDGQVYTRMEIKGNNELSELGRAINTMTEKLEQIDTSRQEFVANVSHELKTPLSSIKVLSDTILLQEEMPTEMYREFLQDINSEIDRMSNIITDLLSLVKLDYREPQVNLNISDLDLNNLLSEIIKRLYPLAEQKNIDIVLENYKNVSIEADEMKISLAISNLVENAIKYTPEGGNVKVTIDSDHQNSFITVQDTGIGISEEEQGKIFNRFYRVDKTRDRETGGTGLGLSITHSTVLLHNGSIKVNSREDEGSTFAVRLPIKSSILKNLEN